MQSEASDMFSGHQDSRRRNVLCSVVFNKNTASIHDALPQIFSVQLLALQEGIPLDQCTCTKLAMTQLGKPATARSAWHITRVPKSSDSKLT